MLLILFGPVWKLQALSWCQHLWWFGLENRYLMLILRIIRLGKIVYMAVVLTPSEGFFILLCVII